MGCSSSKPEEPKFVAPPAPAAPAPASPKTPASPGKGLLRAQGSSGSLNGGITFSPGTVFPEQLQGKQAMMIPVPSGFRSGDQLLVETPDGRKSAIVIPAGAKSGQLFQANLPQRRVSSEMSPKHDPALKRTASSSSTNGDGAAVDALQDKFTAAAEQPPAALPNGESHERAASSETVKATSTEAAAAEANGTTTGASEDHI